MGAPDTFDAAGYVALLARVCGRARTTSVYAPEFRRELEEPSPGAIAVPRAVPLVVTEGNYLLVDDGDWARVRPLLDEAWYVEMDEAAVSSWLIARHVEFGKAPTRQRAWVMRSDQANAAVVARTRERADVIVGSQCSAVRAAGRGPHARRRADATIPRHRVVRPLVDEDERAGDAVGGVGLDRQRPRDAEPDAADVVEREAVGTGARSDVARSSGRRSRR